MSRILNNTKNNPVIIPSGKCYDKQTVQFNHNKIETVSWDETRFTTTINHEQILTTPNFMAFGKFSDSFIYLPEESTGDPNEGLDIEYFERVETNKETLCAQRIRFELTAEPNFGFNFTNTENNIFFQWVFQPMLSDATIQPSESDTYTSKKNYGSSGLGYIAREVDFIPTTINTNISETRKLFVYYESITKTKIIGYLLFYVGIKALEKYSGNINCSHFNILVSSVIKKELLHRTIQRTSTGEIIEGRGKNAYTMRTNELFQTEKNMPMLDGTRYIEGEYGESISEVGDGTIILYTEYSFNNQTGKFANSGTAAVALSMIGGGITTAYLVAVGGDKLGRFTNLAPYQGGRFSFTRVSKTATDCQMTIGEYQARNILEKYKNGKQTAKLTILLTDRPVKGNSGFFFCKDFANRDYDVDGTKPALYTAKMIDGTSKQRNLILDVGDIVMPMKFIKKKYAPIVSYQPLSAEFPDKIVRHELAKWENVEQPLSLDRTGQGKVFVITGCEYQQGESTGGLLMANLELQEVT
jgi:hypothetical protein